MSLLQNALRANAAFSAMTGVSMVLFASPLSHAIGLSVAWPLSAIGVGLVVFAGDVLLQSRHPSPQRALLTSLADLGWVAGTGLLFALAPEALNAAGWVTAAVVAAFVLAFALGQLLGLSRPGPSGFPSGVRH